MRPPAPRWTPLREFAEGHGPALDAVAHLVDAERARLTCGDYRWRNAGGFLDSVVALHDDTGLRALAAHRLEDNDDPEIAAAAGRRVIRVPLLTQADPQCATTAAVADLIGTLRAIHGSHRISINLPARSTAWSEALAGAGFRLDSAMSVRTIAGALPHRDPRRIRPATSSNDDAAADLFDQSSKALATHSPFVVPDPAAAAAVRDRIGSCRDGQTRTGSRVWVSEEAGSGVIGIVEISRTSSPDDFAILQTPLGESGCIDWVAVAPSRRGEGIGAALVAHAQQQLADAGATTAHAYHLTGDQGPGAFWARCGFTPAWVTWELASPAGGTGG